MVWNIISNPLLEKHFYVYTTDFYLHRTWKHARVLLREHIKLLVKLFMYTRKVVL
jgi:hypothetical protein